MDVIFPASMEKLHDMLLLIHASAKEVGFSDKEISNIEVALEEALVNIIKHGYVKKSGEIEISFRKPSRGGIKIVLKDQGISYNPLEHIKKVNLSESTLESDSVGGYGVYLIVRIMDEIDYQREGKSNILTLVKYQPE